MLLRSMTLRWIAPSRKQLAAALLAIPMVLGFVSPSQAWWNDQWAARKRITIDASNEKGANGQVMGVPIAEAIGTAPVLVRLHQGNFVFRDAKENCGDFRFIAADDKTPLNYQIERCDPLLNEALVWVKVKDIAPNAKTTFWLYFGNKNAPAVSPADAKATYDTDTVLDYHFDERNAPAQDATVWSNTSQTTGQPAEGSIIGRGLRLSGQPLTIPGSPSLAWPDATALTWSAWIKMAAPQPNAVIYSRRNLASGLIIGVDQGVPYFEVAAGTGTRRAPAGAAIEAGKWVHLALVADGARVTLYVNGIAVSNLDASLPQLSSVAFLGGDTLAALEVPKAPDAVATPPAGALTSPEQPAAGPQSGDVSPKAEGVTPAPTEPVPATPAAAPAPAFTGFIGDIDELTIAKVARPVGFLKLAAVGQGGPQMSQLITYSVNEQNGAWFTGYFAVLIKSVTTDGWVVISILGIMLISSWWVMIRKNASLGRKAKANRLFTKRFARLSEDFAAIRDGEDVRIVTQTAGQITSADRRMTAHSSLYHLYSAGIEEVRTRLKRSKRGPLSGQALASIRATMDGVLVREIQNLRSGMIVLTIAIAGGPFLGLLGTVIGVMITFAAIALSGDVNINAIAPGVAGALVATVCGLIVAIPALFGYNLLTTRVNNQITDMQVFVDEFITKISEYYADTPPPEEAELAPLGIEQRRAAE